MNQSEITAAISEMNKKMEKNDQKIVALSGKMESINKVLESRVAMKKKYSNEQKELETENDLLQVKTLRELCAKANISMQEIFSAAFAALMDKVSNNSKGENPEIPQEGNSAEKSDEDFSKSSSLSESAAQKPNKGKPMTPLEKAKLEQQKRIAQKQTESPPKQQPVQKNSLEERLSAYMGR